MAIPNPNPNIADGIKSDNKTYSSNKIESLIKTATELPIPEAGDAGKVITVNAGETAYELATPVAPESIIDDNAAAADTVYSSSKIDTLLSAKANTTQLANIIRSYATTEVNLTANTITTVNFSVTVPTGYKVIGAFDQTYRANIIGAPIQLTDAGNASFAYFATASMSNLKLSIHVILAKNVTDAT